jgi:hypothetical protein
MFLVYGGVCLSRNAIHNWVEKFSRGRSNVADDARSGAEVAETTVKILLCCGFRRTGKTMGQVYQCWRICREIYVFSRYEYHMFYVLYLWPIFWLSLVIAVFLKMTLEPTLNQLNWVHPFTFRSSYKIHFPFSLDMRASFDLAVFFYRGCT